MIFETLFSRNWFVRSTLVSLTVIFLSHFSSSSAVADETERKILGAFKSALLYQGPLVIVISDHDGNIGPIDGNMEESGFVRVFRWDEPTSPFFDAQNSGVPEYFDVPMLAWERGVKETIPEYRNVPIKKLIGKYADPARRIRDPGNSHYDISIKLPNGTEFNPRDFYVDPKRSYEFFRTTLPTEKTVGHFPLANSAKAIAESKNFGPMWPLIRLASHPDMPVMTMVLTVRGNREIEWEQYFGTLVESGDLHERASIQGVFAGSNTALTKYDATSISRFNRQDLELGSLKNVVLEYVIDNILLQRIDRTNGLTPLPNVLIYPEDDLGFVEKAASLFESKARGIQHYDPKGNLWQPPIKLIIGNTAPHWLYQKQPVHRHENPQALTSPSADLGSVMIYDSQFILKNRAYPEMINHRDLDQIMVSILTETYGVSRKTAAAVLEGSVPCKVLLKGGRE